MKTGPHEPGRFGARRLRRDGDGRGGHQGRNGRFSGRRRSGGGTGGGRKQSDDQIGGPGLDGKPQESEQILEGKHADQCAVRKDRQAGYAGLGHNAGRFQRSVSGSRHDDGLGHEVPDRDVPQEPLCRMGVGQSVNAQNIRRGDVQIAAVLAHGRQDIFNGDIVNVVLLHGISSLPSILR